MDELQTFFTKLDDGQFWVLYALCVALALGCLPATFYFMRHRRIAQDTPTSKIRSASQGFVELQGHARSFDDAPLRSPGKHRDCAWYDYKVEERQRRGKSHQWVTVAHDRSTYSFYVDDGTGVCAIDPQAAKMMPKTTDVWRHGQHRFTEARIDEREFIYCLGQFETEQGYSREKAIKESTRAYLYELKRNRDELLRQFDSDGDGEIDMDEWQRARAAAHDHARREVLDDYQPIQHHSLVQPFNKKFPFVVSGYDQRTLTQRYLIFALTALVGFFVAGTFTIVMTTLI